MLFQEVIILTFTGEKLQNQVQGKSEVVQNDITRKEKCSQLWFPTPETKIHSIQCEA